MVLPLIGIVLGGIAIIGLGVAAIASSPDDDEMPDVGALVKDGLVTVGYVSEGMFYGALKALPISIVIILLFNMGMNLSDKVRAKAGE